MSLVNIIGVSLSFADREIFKNVAFRIEAGDRIGLAGPNGSGKTTLLKIIIGEVASDAGEVRITKGVRVSYLSQDGRENLTGPILDSVYKSAPGRIEVLDGIKKIENMLSSILSEEEQARLAQQLADLHHRYSALEDMYPRHKAEKILIGLGFKSNELYNDMSILSGGWKTRAALASMLFQEPDLLLMDEPTNHLDVPSVHWLELFLKTYKGAIVLVSHDRDFLNRQTKRTIAIEIEGLRIYNGNYDHYLRAREEEEIFLEAQTKRTEQKVKDAQKFIDRFRYKSSKARQAQSKIKLIEKIELVQTYKPRKTIHFSFPDVARSGRDVVSIRDLSKSFENKIVFQNLNLSILRGEKIALIGPNGSGKTTLLKIIAGELEQTKGNTVLGHGVEMSYFAQHHSEMLHQSKTVVEEVYASAPTASITFIRNACGAFLFSGSDVDKPVPVLSGGERARVALAKLLVNPGNFMIMDEPTNHLDLYSSEILIEALSKYEGTLLFVSHNQSFISKLATKIWDLDKGSITEYHGSLSEYYDHLEKEWDNTRSEVYPQNIPADIISERKSKKDIKREQAEQRKLKRERLKPLKDELDSVEECIEKNEKREAELNGLLADPDLFADQSKSVPLMKEYKQIKEDLEELMVRWEHLNSELEIAESEFASDIETT